MPKKAKTPLTRFPHAVMADYYTAIKKLLEEAHSKVWDTFQNEVRPKIHEHRANMRQDDEEEPPDDNTLQLIQEALDRVREQAISVLFNASVLNFIAKRFVSGVNKINRMDIQKQANVLRAIDPTANEPWLNAFMMTSIRENVNYIKSIPGEYFNRIETIVFQGVKSGQNINDMASDIRKVKEVSFNRAKFIAKDQSGSILGQMTQIRHKNMGVKKFKWRTSKDERVRGKPSGRYPKATPSHYDLDGNIYNYEDPPHGLVPGRDYNCRCVAIPIVEEGTEE